MIGESSIPSTALLAILDRITVKSEPWEADEHIVTINGKPVGSTIPRGLPVESLWATIKREIAREIANAGLHRTSEAKHNEKGQTP